MNLEESRTQQRNTFCALSKVGFNLVSDFYKQLEVLGSKANEVAYAEASPLWVYRTAFFNMGEFHSFEDNDFNAMQCVQGVTYFNLFGVRVVTSQDVGICAFRFKMIE